MPHGHPAANVLCPAETLQIVPALLEAHDSVVEKALHVAQHRTARIAWLALLTWRIATAWVGAAD